MNFNNENQPQGEVTTPVDHLRELLARARQGLLVPATQPVEEWLGDPSKLVIFDDDKDYPVKETA
jgi:hypothetical protein